MKIVYGTGNPAKLQAMVRMLEGLPIELIGLEQAFLKKGLAVPKVEETGQNSLENAALKAHAYYACLRQPVFSCDSGLYLRSAATGQPLPEELQPGICIRGRGEKRCTDEEVLARYIGLVKEYGPILARYKNSICLMMDEERVYESMDEGLFGEEFLLTDIPHAKKVPGFPLDGISLEVKSGKYYYDLEDNLQDNLAGKEGFRQFFAKYVKDANLRDA